MNLAKKYKQPKPSEVEKFRRDWKKKGYELIDITPLCKIDIGNSGWCNNYNEPDQDIHHIKLTYRGYDVATISPALKQNNVDDYITIFISEDPVSNDFIVFRKVKITK